MTDTWQPRGLVLKVGEGWRWWKGSLQEKKKGTCKINVRVESLEKIEDNNIGIKF